MSPKKRSQPSNSATAGSSKRAFSTAGWRTRALTAKCPAHANCPRRLALWSAESELQQGNTELSTRLGQHRPLGGSCFVAMAACPEAVEIKCSNRRLRDNGIVRGGKRNRDERSWRPPQIASAYQSSIIAGDRVGNLRRRAGAEFHPGGESPNKPSANGNADRYPL